MIMLLRRHHVYFVMVAWMLVTSMTVYFEYTRKSVTTDDFFIHLREKMIANPSLNRFGYKLYFNGRTIDAVVNEVAGIWAYGNLDDFEPVVLSHSRPGVFYLLYRSDCVNEYEDKQKPFVTFLRQWSAKQPPLVVITCSLDRDVRVSNPRVRFLVLPTPFAWTDIRLPVSHNDNDGYEAWSRSKIHKAYWVGATNGIFKNEGDVTYRGTRLNIYRAVRNHPRVVEFHFSHNSHLKSEFPHLDRPVSIDEQSRYKLILCLDGWGFPGNLHWVLTRTDCVPVISTRFAMGFVENHLRPWEHYIPAHTDGTDVVQNVTRALDPRNSRRLYDMRIRLNKVVRDRLNPQYCKNELVQSMRKISFY